MFVDVGYQRRGFGQNVRRIYELICRFAWCGLKGEDRESYPHLDGEGRAIHKLYSKPKWGDPQMGKALQGRRYANYFLFASGPVADIVKRLREGRGAKWVNPPDAKEHMRQLFAENKRKRINEKTGREEWTWVQTRRDNHAFDLWKMAVVTALMHPRIALDTFPSTTGNQKLLIARAC